MFVQVLRGCCASDARPSQQIVRFPVVRDHRIRPSSPPSASRVEDRQREGADKSDLERLSIRLNETFSPSRLDYTGTVEASYTQTLFIMPRVSGQAGSLTINGAEVTPGTAHAVPLSLGENRFTIAVGSGGDARSYRLTVTRCCLAEIAPATAASPRGASLAEADAAA
jgi:hypothetical protein